MSKQKGGQDPKRPRDVMNLYCVLYWLLIPSSSCADRVITDCIYVLFTEICFVGVGVHQIMPV